MAELNAQWIDPWQTDALPWEIAGIALEAGLQAHVLLDMAFAPDQWQELPATAISLFESCYSGPGLARLAPCVVPLSCADVDSQNHCWRALLQLSSGKPMLSVLVSSASAIEVATHLVRQWEAVSADGEAWLLRWADTRVLPALAGVLDADQQHRVLGGLQRWYYGTRQGQWAMLEGQPARPFDPSATPLRFTEAQQASLEEQALADEICHYVLGHRQLRPKKLTPSQVHACIARRLGKLRHRGVTDTALLYRSSIKAVSNADLAARDALDHAGSNTQ